MNKKAFIIIIGLLTVVNLVATGTILYERFTHPKPAPFKKHERPDHFKRMREKLDLTPEQMQSLEESRREYWEYAKEPIQAIGRMKLELFREMTEETPDQNDIDSLIEEIARREIDLKKFTVEHILEEGRHLKPEQRRQMIKMFMDKLDGGKHRPMMHRKFRNDNRGKHDENSFEHGGHPDRRFPSSGF
ncbi:MAG: periplasmic heavy metal sensor [candidate division Zixibacteria bacterium]|nr:periplasmic heavy metal sensor [candidate division Zixibacteria bacterium]